jgi:quercetin dioxygenase-like cupin family protein
VRKIRVREQATLDAAKMAKVALAATPRALLDLYCVAPGQAQKPHVHDAQDKIYYVVAGAGRFSLGPDSERLEAGEALVVTPPPPHAKVPGH